MIKIDKTQILNEFKAEHPEYADKDIFVDPDIIILKVCFGAPIYFKRLKKDLLYYHKNYPEPLSSLPSHRFHRA